MDALARALDADRNEARLAAGYAPTRPHVVNGFTIELPGEIEFVMPYSPDITSEAEAQEFADAVRIAFEVYKQRKARDKNKP